MNLYSAAEKALHSLAQAAEKAEVAMELTGDSVAVTGIPQLIDSIIYNICDNAVKYSRKGGKVDISVLDEGETALFKVSDTGIGIPPEHLDRIFERFYRVDKSRSKDVGGTGLGLSIVKHAAKVLNAEISIESTVGKGTAVAVRFKK